MTDALLRPISNTDVGDIIAFRSGDDALTLTRTLAEVVKMGMGARAVRMFGDSDPYYTWLSGYHNVIVLPPEHRKLCGDKLIELAVVISAEGEPHYVSDTLRIPYDETNGYIVYFGNQKPDVLKLCQIACEISPEHRFNLGSRSRQA